MAIKGGIDLKIDTVRTLILKKAAIGSRLN
jgi:hypothetical protein